MYILIVRIKVNRLSTDVTFNYLYFHLFKSQPSKPISTINKRSFHRLHKHTRIKRKRNFVKKLTKKLWFKNTPKSFKPSPPQKKNPQPRS